MSTAAGESLDQPSDEAIARLHALTRGPGMDEINRLDLPRTNTGMLENYNTFGVLFYLIIHLYA